LVPCAFQLKTDTHSNRKRTVLPFPCSFLLGVRYGVDFTDISDLCFARGFALEFKSVGIVDRAVEDGIGQGCLPFGFMPVLDGRQYRRQVTWREGLDPEAEVILLYDKIAMSAYRGRCRFSSLAERSLRRGKAHGVAYCSDGTIRKLLGYSDRKLAPPYSALLFFNPCWTGVPVLSDPIGKYKLEDLKKKARRCVGDPYWHPDTRREIKGGITAAQTFSDIVDVGMKW
jgi:hypothetical protein